MMQLKISLPTFLKTRKVTVVPGSEINGRVISTMLFPTDPVPMLIEEERRPVRGVSRDGEHSLAGGSPAVAPQILRRAA